MQVHNAVKDKQYVITAITDTTVKDVESGAILAVVSAETQMRIYSISDQFSTEGDCIVRPFK